MADQNSFSKEDIVNEDADEPNKHLNNIKQNDHFSDVSQMQKLLDSDDSDEIAKLSVLPNYLQEYNDSPRTNLTKYIPNSPFKISGNLCDSKIFVRPVSLGINKSFHVSLSIEDEGENNEVVFSKSYDCSEDTIQSMQPSAPITRSVSEDILQSETATLQRRISVVSSSKGKLIGVPRVRPGEKLVRSPSTTSQTPFGGPARISSTEEMLPKKSRFTTEKKKIAFCLCLYLCIDNYVNFSHIWKNTSNSWCKNLCFSGVGFCGSCNILFGLLDKVNGQVEFAVLCFIVRSFEALGAAAFCTASCTILIDQFPDDIGTIFGFTETCIGVGMSIGPAIGGALYAVRFVVLIVPLCWFLLRNVKDPAVVFSPAVSYRKTSVNAPCYYCVFNISSCISSSGFYRSNFRTPYETV
ncbi:MFS-type transporter SLC18B1 [Caerostris extrusa]|uniref:MFS-type transporter SLC18B1 n=1 Tax=Caerostris extrusa TaxID=172846 RepID=A0AAV4XGP3_CAEEX|nr:MFS-type transporter SLC18B1 [Caerostris extrusa]